MAKKRRGRSRQREEINWDSNSKLLHKNSEDFRKEAKLRRSGFEEKSVPPEDAEREARDGWEIINRFKTKSRLRKKKSIGDALEDKVWTLIANLGLDYLNQGRKFELNFGKSPSQRKQIDIFAVDEEARIILVIECKAKEERGAKSLKQSLNETGEIKSEYTKKMRGAEYRPIFIYATQNINWSDTDKELAEEKDIYIIDDRNIHYFENLFKNLGVGAKSQAYGALFKKRKTKIYGLKDEKVPAFKSEIKWQEDRKVVKKTIYNFMTSARNLQKIAFVNHWGLESAGSDFYQRMIKKNRLIDINKFIKNGGFFATNVLANFPDSRIKFEQKDKSSQSTDDENVFGMLTLPTNYRTMIIIDGQHRLFGCALDEKTINTNLLVTAFTGLSPVQEFKVFSDINSKQQKISPNLLATLKAGYLYSTNKKEALEALASGIILNLDSPKSPLGNRFIPADGSTRSKIQNLNINGIMKELVSSGLVGSHNSSTDNLGSGFLSDTSVEETTELATKVLNGYFLELKNAKQSLWELGNEGKVCTNQSIQAHLRLIAKMFKYLETKGFRPKEKRTHLNHAKILEQLKKRQKPLVDFLQNSKEPQIKTRYDVKLGAGGVSELCEIFVNQIKSTFRDFPNG